MARKKASLGGDISKSVKGTFSLDKFKAAKGLGSTNNTFKEQEWIPLSPAWQETVSLPGIPHGHITLLRGHSDSGKTTALLEVAVNAQKMGILPVFIVTEMKWSWDHAMMMGLEVDLEKDENGQVISVDGNFIYADRGQLGTVEAVAGFMADLMNEQAKGNLPMDMVFLWDSIGSVPCQMSVEKAKNNNEWNAGAMSTQFGNFINQEILLSRKESYPYTNSLVAVNKIWVEKPIGPMSPPIMKNKGGNTMFFDSTLIVTFGNISNAGTLKVNAVKDGKKVEWAKKVKVAVEKNHISGVTTTGKIAVTPHGFISDTKKDIEKYKELHKDEWGAILGEGPFQVVLEGSDEEDFKNIASTSDD
jgi:hypothetical protein|tara:strand:+ start:392 stop:1471 length:1080 start_codon:yes stop_codon:yes gene_type:complete